jgi:hypothetical protein
MMRNFFNATMDEFEFPNSRSGDRDGIRGNHCVSAEGGPQRPSWGRSTNTGNRLETVDFESGAWLEIAVSETPGRA